MQELETFAPDTPRLIGAYDRGHPGPLLIVTAAVHGNEPAGVHALQRVLAELERARPALAGRMVGLIGNRAALAQGVRFVEWDLNRLWSPADLVRLTREDGRGERHEKQEQRELVAAIDAELARGHAEVVHLDLHSTSGDGPPFSVFHDDAENRRVAHELGVPAILGLLKNVEGTILDFAASRGFTCVVLEGGQNAAPSTIDHHEAAVWLTLHTAGLLELAPEDYARRRAAILRSVEGLPDAVEVCLRYHIEDGERFQMLPGFKNFQPVRQGQLLALGGKSGTREIRCPMGAILLMPRYQGQGVDGFFLARTVELVA